MAAPAAVMVVKAALGEVQFVQNVLHGCLLVSARIEQAFRRIQQCLTPVVSPAHPISPFTVARRAHNRPKVCYVFIIRAPVRIVKRQKRLAVPYGARFTTLL